MWRGRGAAGRNQLINIPPAIFRIFSPNWQHAAAPPPPWTPPLNFSPRLGVTPSPESPWGGVPNPACAPLPAASCPSHPIKRRRGGGWEAAAGAGCPPPFHIPPPPHSLGCWERPRPHPAPPRLEAAVPGAPCQGLGGAFPTLRGGLKWTPPSPSPHTEPLMDPWGCFMGWGGTTLGAGGAPTGRGADTRGGYKGLVTSPPHTPSSCGDPPLASSPSSAQEIHPHE